jgi:hypothetical protein
MKFQFIQNNMRTSTRSTICKCVISITKITICKCVILITKITICKCVLSITKITICKCVISITKITICSSNIISVNLVVMVVDICTVLKLQRQTALPSVVWLRQHDTRISINCLFKCVWTVKLSESCLNKKGFILSNCSTGQN